MSRPQASCAFAIMAKAPRLGAIKTRLVPPLGIEEAATLGRCFIRDIAANIASAAPDGSIDGYVAYTPVGSEALFDGLLPAGFRLLPPRGRGLGEGLLHAAEDLLAAGYRGVCLVNADSPTLPTAVLARAFATLDAAPGQLVLGPAVDGGYYLIGLGAAAPRLFDQIDWSTDRVLRQTTERAAELGLAVELLPPWYDVDDVASLRILCAELFDDTRPKGFAAPQTRSFLDAWLAAGGASRLGI